MAGPRGNHNNHDAYDGAEPAKPAPPPKLINPSDSKLGPAKPGSSPSAGINQDTYHE